MPTGAARPARPRVKSANDVRAQAQAIVEFWHNRRYLPVPSSLHVHPMDLGKLEELIAEALGERDAM
jgi:hypothetical protein